MARAEQVCLQEVVSAGTPTGSLEPVIERMTSQPLELSWESFTLPLWIMTRLRAGCPSMNRTSSRTKVRALAHEAISKHSPSVRPVKSADAHIIATRSATSKVVVDGPLG